MTYLRIILPVGVVLAIAFLYLMWTDAAASRDEYKAQLKDANATIERVERRNQDLETEAVERLVDDTAVEKMGKKLTDAIDAVPPAQRSAAPSPATVALGCARLRQTGATSDAFKRICGAGQGVAGAKAAAKR